MRIVAYLRRHHVGLLALFVALGGTTAYATHAPDLTTSEDIRDGEVMNQDLGDDSVSSAKIQTQGVTTGDLAPNSVSSTRIPDEAVGTSEIAQGSVFNADLAANSITDTRIAADAVGSSELKPDSVGAAELAPNSVAAGDVNNDTLSEADIGDFERTNLIVGDGSDDGTPSGFTLDGVGPFTVLGKCDRDDPNVRGWVTIRSNGAPGWRMDSTGSNGQSDQVNLGTGTPNERQIIAVGPTNAEHYRTGDFAAAVGDTDISGQVAVRVVPPDDCEFEYTRFGPN